MPKTAGKHAQTARGSGGTGASTDALLASIERLRDAVQRGGFFALALSDPAGVAASVAALLATTHSMAETLAGIADDLRPLGLDAENLAAYARRYVDATRVVE